MMINFIIHELSNNRDVFRSLLSGLSEEVYLWKPSGDKWCLLEVVSHLCDEEVEDFRTRVKQVLEDPKKALPPIDPVGWVKQRKYIEQNFAETLTRFIDERDNSVRWLQSLRSVNWDNAFQHPKFGSMSARLFISNWLAHDYLHIRQVLFLKRGYFASKSTEPLDYAGNW